MENGNSVLITIKHYARKVPGYGALRSLRSTFKTIRTMLKNYYLDFCKGLLPRNYYVQELQSIVRETNRFNEVDILSNRYSQFSGKYTLRDRNRVHQLAILMEQVNLLPEGDYAEVGTYRGAFAHCIWNLMDQNQKLYIFDTFEGFAKTDVDKEKESTGFKTNSGNFSDTSMDVVLENILLKNGSRKDSLILVKGFFPDTFMKIESRKWRFVSLDCDLYAPTIAGLSIFWNQLVPGGMIIVHDYLSNYIGIHKAVKEFSAEMGIIPIPLCDKSGSALFVKL